MLVWESETNCGFSGNVIRLAQAVPSHVNHKFYFDNYFKCPKLQIFLAKRGITLFTAWGLSIQIGCQIAISLGRLWVSTLDHKLTRLLGFATVL